MGNIVDHSGKWRPGQFDYKVVGASGWPFLELASNSLPVASVLSRINKERDRIDQIPTHYEPGGPNSNSFAAKMAKAAGVWNSLKAKINSPSVPWLPGLWDDAWDGAERGGPGPWVLASEAPSALRLRTVETLLSKPRKTIILSFTGLAILALLGIAFKVVSANLQLTSAREYWIHATDEAVKQHTDLAQFESSVRSRTNLKSSGMVSPSEESFVDNGAVQGLFVKYIIAADVKTDAQGKIVSASVQVDSHGF